MKKTLFDVCRIGSLSLKNRVVLAPLTRGRAGESRQPNEMMGHYYKARSSAGLLISEATSISEEGLGWIGSPGIYSERMVEGWRQVVCALDKAPLFLQLWHCGRASHSDFLKGSRPFSASAVKLNRDFIRTPRGERHYEVPQPMTKADIARTVDHYRRAVLLAKQAGCAGVEIHAANGYLINQFIDASSNLRTDEYGGSLENRFRFLREIVEAILTVLRPEQVGVRISPNGSHNNMDSPDFREMNLYIAKELNQYALGYLHVMDGLAFGFHEMGAPMTLAEFRPLFDQVLIGNCGYTLETAQAAIASGDADLIAFGRPYITNPDLVERFQTGQQLNRWDDNRYWYGGGELGYTVL